MNNQKHTLKEHYGLFIGGQWRDASDKAVYTSTNPANGEILAQCAQATKEDVDAAVAAAWKAFPEWKTQTKEARALILEKMAGTGGNDGQRKTDPRNFHDRYSLFHPPFPLLRKFDPHR